MCEPCNYTLEKVLPKSSNRLSNSKNMKLTAQGKGTLGKRGVTKCECSEVVAAICISLIVQQVAHIFCKNFYGCSPWQQHNLTCIFKTGKFEREK